MTTYTLLQLTGEYVIVGLLLDHPVLMTMEMDEAVLYHRYIRDHKDVDVCIEMYLSGRLTGIELKKFIVYKGNMLFAHHFESDKV